MSRAAQSELSRIDPALGSRFEVVERHAGGEGWSAAVRPRRGGASVLLKVLHPGVEICEPSLLASLRHPWIPAVREVGRTARGDSYLVRDYLPGAPISRCFPLQPGAAIELATELLELLAFVHLRGILHLDVKPANVLACAAADGGEVSRFALLDFGLGRRGRGSAAGGTPFFAAPELLLGLQPGPRADLFSLGALLLVALRAAPVPLARFQERFPREDFFAATGVAAQALAAPFDELLPRLLARSPEHRCADAQEALELLVGGSGRPTATLLRPDVVRLLGPRLEAAGAAGGSLRIAGGDAADRQALALHAACALEGVAAIELDTASCLLRRRSSGEVAFAIPAMSERELAGHLEGILALDAEPALAAARALQEHGADSPAQIAAALGQLVERGRILPDGPRWMWPDALAGRIDLAGQAPLAATPRALRAAAARGHVEAAMGAYRAGASTRDAGEDRELRAALAEGFLLGGEPSRALPLTPDLSLHKARALLDLGRIRDAEQVLAAIEPGARERQTSAAAHHLRACLAYARGDFAAAEGATRHPRGGAMGQQTRVLRGLVLTRLGHKAEAIRVLRAVLGELDAVQAPFLAAAALTNLAEVERARGDIEAAQAHQLRALQLYRSIGHVRHTATSESNLGVLAKDGGRFDAARAHLRRARSLYAHLGDRTGAALAEANLGIVSLRGGDAAGGRRRLEQALHQLEELGSAQALPAVLIHLARACAELGDRSRAQGYLERAGAVTEERLMQEAREIRRMVNDHQPPSRPANHSEPRRKPPPAPAEPDGGLRVVPHAVFRTFLGVNHRLATEADLERAMEFLLDAAVTLIGGRIGYLLLVRADGTPTVELRTGSTQASVSAYSRSLVNRAIQRQQVLTERDATADRELLEMPSVRELRHRSAICVPFTSAGSVQGAIYVEHPGRAGLFGEVAIEYLDALADQAAIAVDRVIHEEQLAAELAASRRALHAARRSLAPGGKAVMLGQSEPMAALRAEIDKLAGSDLPVLVLGETGTGKELVARALHEQSDRAAGSFVAESCSAIPTDLLESELFGHVKGAFTGAHDDKPGLLELAARGTLFLDEVGDMPAVLQAKLLRVLQERSARRIGGSTLIPLDIRLVAATHRNLRELVAAGSFRDDLYFRLAAAEIRVPPLRERERDVLVLAEEFLARLNREHRRSKRLSAAARDELLRYPWPGNVRELEHVVARAFLLADGDALESFGLPVVAPAVAGPGSPSTSWPVVTLAEAEAYSIRAALQATSGDKTKAAKVLKISRTALYEKLKRMTRDGR